MKMHTRWTLTALAVLLVAAPGLEAQSAAPATDEAKRVALAEKLEQQARDASADMETFGKASSLYREAAETLGDHPDAADHLVHAGRLAYYTGDRGRAIEDFRAAGEQALEWGDVLVAAQAFLDAAWVAAEEERGTEARELAQRAERLSSSPLIQRQERASLLSRIADLQQQD